MSSMHPLSILNFSAPLTVRPQLGSVTMDRQSSQLSEVNLVHFGRFSLEERSFDLRKFKVYQLILSTDF
jgi:hypothetical protein